MIIDTRGRFIIELETEEEQNGMLALCQIAIKAFLREASSEDFSSHDTDAYTIARKIMKEVEG